MGMGVEKDWPGLVLGEGCLQQGLAGMAEIWPNLWEIHMKVAVALLATSGCEWTENLTVNGDVNAFTLHKHELFSHIKRQFGGH